MNLYLDTSALVKLFVQEEGRERVRSSIDDAPIVATSVIAYAECRAAFARRHRSGDLDQDQLDAFVMSLDALWPGLARVSVTEAIARQAGHLAESGALRGFDAVHLASALRFADLLGDMRFLAFDRRLVEAAAAAGLAIVPS